MDFSVKHWEPFPRHFPSRFPVISADYVAHKDNWVRMSFKSCNFSLILRGRGEYSMGGKTWSVEAPCVITQWPGRYVEYGPPLPEGTWDELYIIYDAALVPRFQQCHFLNLRQPVWPIADLATVLAQADELAALTKSATPESVVDHVDRLCERMLLGTWLRAHTADETDRAIQATVAGLRQNLAGVFDLDAAAAGHGMSLSTFRRRWNDAMKMPPARYLQELRMREACRQLAETTRPVQEIARAVGFADELYFSRRFHQQMRMPPRAYRKLYLIRNRGN